MIAYIAYAHFLILTAFRGYIFLCTRIAYSHDFENIIY